MQDFTEGGRKGAPARTGSCKKLLGRAGESSG